MTKRSKVTLFGLLALIAAFGLILTGCPDAAGGSETIKEVPDAVSLAAGSHGFPKEDKIIAVAAGGTYVLRAGNSWYGVKTDGTLDVAKDNPRAAAALAGALVGSTIADTLLTKGTTYNVYAYIVGAASNSIGNGGTADIDTDGRNTIVNVDGIADASTLSILAGANSFGGSLVFLTDTDGVKSEAAGRLSVHSRIKGNTSGQTYSFSALAGSAELEAVTAGKDYFILKNISSDFAATITAAAVATTPKLATASHGAVTTSGQIGSLGTSLKYAVQWRGDWYPLTATGLGTKADLVTAARAALTATAIGSATASGIDDDEVYNVFAVGEFTVTSKVIPTHAGVAVKNNIVDVSSLTTSAQTFGTSSAGATANSPTNIFILSGPITGVSGGITSGTPVQVADNMIVTCGSVAAKVTTSTNSATGTNLTAKEGDQFITVLDNVSNLALTFTLE